MGQPLPDTTKARVAPEPPAREASAAVVLGVAMVVPLLLCCLLPLLLAAGVGTVVAAAGGWLAGFGGIEIAAGAAAAAAVVYGLFFWRRVGLRRGGEFAPCELPGSLCAFESGSETLGPGAGEPVPSRVAAARAAALGSMSNRD